MKRTKMKTILTFVASLACAAFSLSTHAEALVIRELPNKLPFNMPLGQYSPPIGIAYSGLKPGANYTLKAWILVPGPWNCGSSATGWCERTVALSNASGTNVSGTLWFAPNTDVYDYAQFDWVFRLLDAAMTEVTMTERYLSGTANRPPVLSPVGNRFAVVGEPLGFTISATDPEGQTIQFGGTNLPTGAALNAVTGEFLWTPSAVGTYGPLVFWAQDNGDGQLKDAELVTITVRDLPHFVTHPAGQAVPVGSTVNFSAVATSSVPVRYQWYFGSASVPSATNTTLVLTNISAAQAGEYAVVASNVAGARTGQVALLTVFVPRTPCESAQLSLQHLRQVQDQYHRSLQVYTDIGEGGNHFHARGAIPNETAAAGIYGSWPDGPHSGATCIRCTFTNLTGLNYAGFYLLNGILVGTVPRPYFGESVVPGTNIVVTNFTGLNLAGAPSLSFWARGENGGERIEFFVGGVGRDSDSGTPITPFPDSMPRYPARGAVTQLTRAWQRYSIDLSGQNLTNLMGGFGWMANAPNNPAGAVFYVDDIEFNLSSSAQSNRLAQPRFLRSFLTKPVEPIVTDSNLDDDLDFVLRNTAFLYDNALALLAFLADATPDSLRRSRLIGDAMVYAQQHDRTFTNGCLRTGYASGDLALPPGWTPNGRRGAVAIPGFYLEDPQQFYEVENENIDTGNNAWAMIALLALHRQTGDTNYLAAARRIGQFIESFRDSAGTYQGYRGGIAGAESSSPTNRAYASTEHNLDIHAAFMEMYRRTGEPTWLARATHARQFVESMWDTGIGLYRTGTLPEAPETRNETPGQLPLDTQSWAVLSLDDVLMCHHDLLPSAELALRTQHSGFVGFDFNEDRDGVWFEGTAQMAVAYAVAGLNPQVAGLRSTLFAAQQMPAPYGDGLGMPAASREGMSSGFGFKLFRRTHVGATAWNVFAQLRFNPYYQTRISRLSSVGFDANKRFTLRLLGDERALYRLEKSSDLKTWLPFSTNSPGVSGELLFTDPQTATGVQRFYRGTWLGSCQ